VAIFLGILLTQCIDYSFYPVITIAGFFTRMFIGYALIRLVPEFLQKYLKVMVALALLSFIIYIPYILLSTAGYNIEGLITRVSEQLGIAGGGRRPVILYTFSSAFSPRNSGMFGEPGMFAGYLIMGLIALAVVKKIISRKQYLNSLIILTIALLTTMSTTGYIAFTLVPLLHYEWKMAGRSRVLFRIFVAVYVLLPLLIGGALYAYIYLPFMKDKIETQMDIVEMQEGKWHKTRVGSLLFDWEYIRSRPLTGWGLHPFTRHALHPWMNEDEGMGNGFSDFTAKFGVTGFLTWFSMVFIGFWRLTRRDRWATLLILALIMIVLQGEPFLNYPFFMGLAFLQPAALMRHKMYAVS
jgi:hypothetical protein